MKPEGMEALSSCWACREKRASRGSEGEDDAWMAAAQWVEYLELPVCLAGGFGLSGFLFTGHVCACRVASMAFEKATGSQKAEERRAEVLGDGDSL
jgi:hypothetical protein